jgi:hypothetical protein
MNLEEAKKTVKALKRADNYFIIKLSYLRLVLPYKAGIQFLEAINQAEKTEDSYGAINKLLPLDKDDISIGILQAEEYSEIKMAQLMNISQAELVTLLNQVNQEEKDAI